MQKECHKDRRGGREREREATRGHGARPVGVQPGGREPGVEVTRGGGVDRQERK